MLMEISKKNSFPCQKLQSRVSFMQLKPVLYFFLCGYSLKILLLLNPMRIILKYVLSCKLNFSCLGLDYLT
jgi:hypothetical protein